MAACDAVDVAVGVRLALPRSIGPGKQSGWKEKGSRKEGGDSIPDETDDGDPAPPALAPRQRAGRVARPPVVAPPPVWRWMHLPSGAAHPAKRLRALGATWQHPSL